MAPETSFASADPSIVRSVKQRDLLNTWLRLWAGRSCPPSLTSYEPARLDEEWSELVRYRVEWNGDASRLIIDSQGARIASAYGRAPGVSSKGTYLDEYLPANRLPYVMPAYDQCVQRALPVYSITRLDDIYGRIVDYERMLLPFSDGDRITHVLASAKTISEDGSFEIRNLMLAERKPELKVRAVIDRDLAVRGASYSRADEVVEI